MPDGSEKLTNHDNDPTEIRKIAREEGKSLRSPHQLEEEIKLL